MLKSNITDGCICQNCGKQFITDLIVPDNIWIKISPKHNNGGILCPNCIIIKINKQKLGRIKAEIIGQNWGNNIPIKCRHSKEQCYECCVNIKPPWKSTHEFISFDACLAKELFYLWDQGIITNGSCCGKHFNTENSQAYISVEDEAINLMFELGYEQLNNRVNEFVPKTNL